MTSIVAFDTALPPPLASSLRVETASNPRKLKAATGIAPATTDHGAPPCGWNGSNVR